MATRLEIPISNVPMGGVYTGVITVASRTPLTVLLDTGSSTIAVDGHAFDPAADPETRTTNLAQTVSYGAGNWVGAVVQTKVALSAEVELGDTQLAVTYSESPGIFGGAQGILGLAYAPLDPAYEMPGDTWAGKYTAAQLGGGTMIDPAPYFTQLEQAGIVANKFAFATQRSSVSLATDDPSTDPDNAGLLILGGGEELTALYTGAFIDVDVVSDVWYDTNLIAVQVGTQPRIPVPPMPAGALGSNSFIDSGTNVLMFEQGVYDRIVAAFGAIDPAFASALTTGALGGNGVPHAQLDLARWPDLTLVLQGHGVAEAALVVTPQHYWNLDAAARGEALAYLCGDRGSLGGRSILGLPLFSGRYTVFDRSMDSNLGIIRFAQRA